MSMGNDSKETVQGSYSDPDGRGCMLALLRLALLIFGIGIGLGAALLWLILKIV